VNSSYDVVIFDIDNVMVDTRASYTDCIRETVQIYLTRFLKIKPIKHMLLTRHDVETFKRLGGFNDDWDTCYGLLLYLCGQDSEIRSLNDLLQTKKILGLLKTSKTPVGVHGIEKRFGKRPDVQMKRVSRLFQALYWSKYIRREKPIISKRVFRHLKKQGIRIAIATGRNLKEANYVLKRFGIRRPINFLVTLNHLPGARFKKPHPYSLLRIAKRFGLRLRYLYIGDLPDDMTMAKTARRQIRCGSWAFVGMSELRGKDLKCFEQAGAERLFSSKQALNRALLSL